MMSKNDAMLENMVEVARFSSSTEAAAARNLLADADIPACLDGEAMASWFWYLGSAIGGVKLFVNEQDAERAASILAAPADLTAFDSVDFHDDSAVDIDVNEELPPQLLRAFRASIIGILLLPPLLNFYSMFLIIRHDLLLPPLNWRVVVACVVNILMLCLASMFLYSLAG